MEDWIYNSILLRSGLSFEGLSISRGQWKTEKAGLKARKDGVVSTLAVLGYFCPKIVKHDFLIGIHTRFLVPGNTQKILTEI